MNAQKPKSTLNSKLLLCAIIFFFSTISVFASPFISTWDTTITTGSTSNATQIKLPLVSTGIYNFYVDWGDSSSSMIYAYNSANTTHTYATGGNKTININGTIIGFSFTGTTDKTKLKNISQWGDLVIGNSSSVFAGCTNFNFVGSDNLNLSGTTTLASMFSGATSFNADIDGWDVSLITDMSSMFSTATAFNKNLTSWNTSSVRNMASMFSGATAFKGNISNWNTSSVTAMNSMFASASTFNTEIGDWDTSNVQNMASMFASTSTFNKPLYNWNTQNVTSMNSMFASSVFNQPIGNWNVDKVTNMGSMFQGATTFNQNLTNWTTASLNTMTSMFYGATAFNGYVNNFSVGKVGSFLRLFQDASNFNQPMDKWATENVSQMGYCFAGARKFNNNISTWNTGSVTVFYHMFEGASGLSTIFNQDISNWNTSSGTTFDWMFNYNSKFNQDISNWNTRSLTSLRETFWSASAFDQNLGKWNISKLNNGSITMNGFMTNAGISPLNYEKTLVGWASQPVRPSAITVPFGTSKYTRNGLIAKNYLTTTNTWSISDGGFYPNPLIYNNRIQTPVYNNISMIGFCNSTNVNISSSSITFNYIWYKNNILHSSGNFTTTNFNSEVNVANISSTNLTVGDNWTLMCRVNDSYYGFSSYVNSSSVQVMQGQNYQFHNINSVITSINPVLMYNIFRIKVNVTDINNDISWVNISVVYENGTIQNYSTTNVSDIYETTDIIAQNTSYNVSVYTDDGTNQTGALVFRVSDVFSPQTTSFSNSIRPSDSLSYLIVINGNTSENLDLNYQVLIENSSFFTINYFSSLNYSYNVSNSINLSSSIYTPSGTYSGNVTVTRLRDNLSLVIPITLNVILIKGQPFIENAANLVISMNENEVLTRDFVINNTGDYNLSNCQPTLTDGFSNWNFYSWSSSNFDLGINETLNITLTFSNPPPTTYNGYVQITCVATNIGDNNTLNVSNQPSVQLTSNAVVVTPPPSGGGGTVTNFATVRATNSLFTVNIVSHEFNVTRGSEQEMEFGLLISNDAPVTMTAKILQNQSILTFEDGSMEKQIQLYSTHNLNATTMKYKVVVADNVTNGDYQTFVEYKVGTVTSTQEMMFHVVNTPLEATLELLDKPVAEKFHLYQILLGIVSVGMIGFFVVKTRREITRFIK